MLATSQLIAGLKASLLIAGRNYKRVAFECTSKGDLALLATNGHMLSRITLPLSVPSLIGNPSFCLETAQITQLLQAIRGSFAYKRPNHRVSLEKQDPASVDAAIMPMGSQTLLGLKSEESGEAACFWFPTSTDSFPAQYRDALPHAITPSPQAVTDAACFNAAYLIDAYKALSYVDPEGAEEQGISLMHVDPPLGIAALSLARPPRGKGNQFEGMSATIWIMPINQKVEAENVALITMKDL